MHMIKPDGPHRPGRSVFSWHDTEAKVKSQFPRITKAASYPSMGPPSRPISQESLRHWEKAARENSYIINHAAGFYCVNTSYPMDNSLSGRRGPARQTSEKDVLCLHRLGRSSAVHSPDGVSYFLPV